MPALSHRAVRQPRLVWCEFLSFADIDRRGVNLASASLNETRWPVMLTAPKT